MERTESLVIIRKAVASQCESKGEGRRKQREFKKLLLRRNPSPEEFLSTPQGPNRNEYYSRIGRDSGMLDEPNQELTDQQQTLKREEGERDSATEGDEMSKGCCEVPGESGGGTRCLDSDLEVWGEGESEPELDPGSRVRVTAREGEEAKEGGGRRASFRRPPVACRRPGWRAQVCGGEIWAVGGGWPTGTNRPRGTDPCARPGRLSSAVQRGACSCDEVRRNAKFPVPCVGVCGGHLFVCEEIGGLIVSCSCSCVIRLVTGRTVTRRFFYERQGEESTRLNASASSEHRGIGECVEEIKASDRNLPSDQINSPVRQCKI